LPGGKPACGRFPRLRLFHLSSLSIERFRISIRHFDVTNIGKTFDMQGMLTERNDISEDVQPAAAIGEPIKINR